MYDKYEIDGIWFDGDCWIMLQLINANVASLTDDTLPPVLDIKLSINAEDCRNVCCYSPKISR